MEIGYECNKCQLRWTGGLHDTECPVCLIADSRTVWTDESLDGQDFEEVYEDECPEEE